MHIVIPALLTILSYSVCYSQTRQVLLVGTYHFENPGLDVVKFKVPDIKSEAKQKEVLEVVHALASFKPDVIFIERPVSYQQKLDSLFNSFKDGKHLLSASETEQLGFRTAKVASARIEAVDFNETNFPFDSLMKSMAVAQQFQMIGDIKKLTDSVQQLYNSRLASLSVKELLRADNSSEMQNANVGFYLSLLPAGVKENHIGSYLVSEWYRRNLVIYENILKRLKPTDKKILVLFGSSHTAMLNNFMQLNTNLTLIPIREVLK